jgi:hypothetical protein
MTKVVIRQQLRQPVKITAQALLQCEFADWLDTPLWPCQTAEHSSMRE